MNLQLWGLGSAPRRQIPNYQGIAFDQPVRVEHENLLGIQIF
jgi:hypothetical protein